MMNTSVADVNMTFTNAVSNTEKSKSNVSFKSSDAPFSQYMNGSAEKTGVSTNENEGVKQTKTVVEKPGRKDLDNQKDSKALEDVNETAENKDLISEVSKKGEEIKDVIKDTLGVTEEELNEVMETMNITIADLLNPDIVKDLILTLNGQDDTVSLLTDETLYSNVTGIVNEVIDTGDALKAELNLSDDDFAKLIENSKISEETPNTPAVETKEPEINQDISDIRVEVTKNFDADVKEVDANNSGKIDVKPEARPEQTTDQRTDVIETSKDEDTEVTVVKTVRSQQTRQNADNNAGSFERNDNENETNLNQAMQSESVQVRQVGDVVETVRQYSSVQDGQEIVRQVTDYIKVNISPETTSMELQLHPASLGTVNMQITSQNGVITAQLLVQDESVKTALESQMMQLQETLEEQGTKVEAVEVAVASYDLNRGPFQDREDRQDRQNADHGRRRINLNLNDLSADDLSNLDEEDQLARHVMEMNGTSIDFSA